MLKSKRNGSHPTITTDALTFNESLTIFTFSFKPLCLFGWLPDMLQYLHTTITCHIVVWKGGYECIPQTHKCFSLASQHPHSWESCGFWGMCMCFTVWVWEGLCPWENEFRWKQTSESVSRRRFKSLLSDNDDERHVDGGVDWYQTDGGVVARLHNNIVMYCSLSTGTTVVPGQTMIKQELV